MEASDWIALGSMITAVCALVMVIWSNWQSNKLVRLEMLKRFDDEFNTVEFKKIRKAAAGEIVDKKDFDKMYDVLDFYEKLGYFAKNGTVRWKDIWTIFRNTIAGYYSFSETVITERRRKDKAFLSGFVKLNNQIEEIEKKENGTLDNIRSKNKIDKFLEFELNIV